MRKCYYIKIKNKVQINYTCSYRIEHSVDEYASCNSIQRKNRAMQNISAAVDIHRRALELISV